MGKNHPGQRTGLLGDQVERGVFVSRGGLCTTGQGRVLVDASFAHLGAIGCCMLGEPYKVRQGQKPDNCQGDKLF